MGPKKMPEYNLKKYIPFEEIDEEPIEYSLEYYLPAQDNNMLYNNIMKETAEYSFLYPAIFVLENARYKVVLGKRWVDKYKNMKKDIPYGLVIDRLHDKHEFLKFLIYLKKEFQGFNIIEKSIALKRAFELSPSVDSDIFTLLDIPKTEKYIHNFLHLSEASDNIKMLILKGALHEYTAFEIFKFPEESWYLLAEFISKISIGTKKRNEIINMIYDMAPDDQSSIRKIIESSELKKIRALQIDPPQIGREVYRFIKKLRYPYISQYREKFDKKLTAVGIDKRFHFIVPRDFEQWEFNIVVSFSSVEDLKNNLEKLRLITEKKSFSELMNSRY